MKSYLQSIGYVFNQDQGLWRRPDYEGIVYSDGDEIEKRLRQIVANASDVSVMSIELANQSTDWPSLYHLSRKRGNLLRPFEEQLQGKSVLEIGAGCGAITRYLGEIGAEVLALEGSPRRASITASRCRGLKNVTILAEAFHLFKPIPQFDVVTLIGVLEYARKFFPGKGADPVDAMLATAKQFLQPGGKLIIAIENQLGLKYFAGFPEDHVGTPMFGIEEHYIQDSVVTFGRRELGARVGKAGLTAQQWWYPFPDYKLPSLMVSEAGALPQDDLDLTPLIRGACISDPQYPAGISFNLERAWRPVVRNGLLGEMANSFLLIASDIDDVAQKDPPLAIHYATDRRPEFAKKLVFEHLDKKGILTRQISLYPAATPNPDSPLTQRLTDQVFVKGELWQDRLLQIMSAPDWRVEQIQEWFKVWLDAFCDLAKIDRTQDITKIMVPGSYFDAIPRNMFIDENNKPKFIDQEWEFSKNIEVGYIIFRAFFGSISSVSVVENQDYVSPINALKLFYKVTNFDSSSFPEDSIKEFIKIDREIKYLSDGIKTENLSNMEHWVIGERNILPIRLKELTQPGGQIATLNQALAERDEQIATLKYIVAERDKQISGLDQAVANLRSEASRVNYVLSRMYRSKSWRITEPLRKLSRITSVVKGPYPIGGKIFNLARGIFRRLPLSTLAKDKLRFWVVARSGIFAGYQVSSWFGPKPPEESVKEIAEECTEHSEYVQFKDRLAKQLTIARSKWTPYRERLLSYEGKDLRRIASSISFIPSRNPKVSIVIPVYGNASLTLECLASIQNSKVAASYEIVLSDDASTDQTPEILGLVNGIKVRRNAKNMGFLRNCNAALSLAVGEYVVYLNNDVQVTDGWLDGLLEVFSTHANAGAVGPKIVYPSGHLQEAGVALKSDGTADMVGLNDNPYAPRYEYVRPVDYCSGACLMIRREFLCELDGFSDEFAPAYCEDADLCLRIIDHGYKVYYTPRAKVVHHLSKTTAVYGMSNKLLQVSINLVKLHNKWAEKLDKLAAVKVIAFYLPQFHPIPENDLWWGKGFTEWTNVKKTRPNFVGHYQPRVPADLGYYDLRDEGVMVAQSALARKYGIDGFCFYYYWFGGKRLLDMPIERMLQTGKPEFPYCLCWANENWSRRWDGRDNEILIGQQHSPEDDRAVILDLIRHFKTPNYIRIDGRPHLIVYRVDLFPDFFATSNLWREICREKGVGDIYISMVESHDLVHKGIHPSTFGCDASIEFPPLNMAEQTLPSGKIINPDFHGEVGDYRDTALQYCLRELPSYTRFRGVMPGWDNSARRQNNGFCFEYSSPEVFQAWLEHVIRQTRQQHHGDEKIVFINAWNEWAEGAYLEPDTRYGHAFLEAVKNAKDAERLLIAEN